MFKLVINHKGKAYNKELNDSESSAFIGKKIKDKVSGSSFGFNFNSLANSPAGKHSGRGQGKSIFSARGGYVRLIFDPDFFNRYFS